MKPVPIFFVEADIPNIQAVVRDGARRTAPAAWAYLLGVAFLLTVSVLQRTGHARFVPAWNVPLSCRAAVCILAILTPVGLTLVGRWMPLEPFLRLCSVVGLATLPCLYLTVLPWGSAAFPTLIVAVDRLQLLGRAQRMRHLRELRLDIRSLLEWREGLGQFVRLREDAAMRVVKARVMPGKLGTWVVCTGRLLWDRLVLISCDLDELFVVDRTSLCEAMNGRSRRIRLRAGAVDLRIDWTPPSVFPVKEWCGLRATAGEVGALLIAEAETRAYANGPSETSPQGLANADLERRPPPLPPSPEVAARARHVAALARSPGDDTKNELLRHLGDPAPEVVAAALDACRQCEIDGLQDRALSLLRSSASTARVAAARYLAEFPCDGALVAVSRAVGGEPDPGTRRTLAQSRFLLRLKA